MKIEVLDTTLRDGAQGEGIEYSISDKKRIALALEKLGIELIEAGNPTGNPKDATFFEEAKKNPYLKTAKLIPFGATCRAFVKAEEDEGLKSLLSTGQEIISIFGKSDIMQVKEVLRVPQEENLRMIEDSVRYLTNKGKRVLYDAEHFFDGMREDSNYAIKSLKAAVNGGASTLVLCDTKGGTLPDQINKDVSFVKSVFPLVDVGIHCHNDMELAVAGTISAVQAGAKMVQGTIGGVGERCGNTDLCSLMPTLQLKMNYDLITKHQLSLLTEISKEINDIQNIFQNRRAPYVGDAAFAHKGGMHIDGVRKNSSTFEHISPEAVGNRRRFLLSDQIGKSGVYIRLKRLIPDIQRDDERVKLVLERLKKRERKGYAYESADGSFDLMALDILGLRKTLFEVQDFHVLSGSKDEDSNSQAYIKILVDGKIEINAAEGKGPVNALDLAIRKALCVFYPSLLNMHLKDFKVRVVNNGGTASMVRVLIESTDSHKSWTTMGVNVNIIQACFNALCDSVEYYLTFIDNNL